MALAPLEKTLYRAQSLEKWEEIGRGGFGTVFKARLKDLGIDVAVKILDEDAKVGDREARFMEKASFQYVVRLYGEYEGPKGERGLVTEFMKWGSIQTLQQKLKKPPWPLAFRLAHETAVAMNYLHKQEIVHQDLKPSNILLSDDLSARLADFGLSTVPTSVVGMNSDTITGGTFQFWPPEAFDASYEPVRAFDVYSFGICLWSIFSGKEPYPGKNRSIVEFRIPEGDRPGCGNNQADLWNLEVDGIKELVGLMRKCWDQNPNNRPRFIEILETTENLLKRHSSGVREAVDEVLTKLDSPNQPQPLDSQPSNQHPGAPHVVAQTSAMEVDQVSERGNSRTQRGAQLNDVVDHRLPAPIPPAASARGDSRRTRTREEKAKFVDEQRARLIQEVVRTLAIADELRVGVGPDYVVHPETYEKIRNEKTSQDKNRVLFTETLLSGGDRVKAAFYDTLWIHEAMLMEKLGE